MGWTEAERHYNESVRDFLQREFTTHKIEAFKLHGFTTAYAAVRHPDGHIYGMVVLLKITRHTICYKDIHENMGPGEADCPAKILDMLSPIPDDAEHKYATEWRHRCRAALNWKKVQADFLKALRIGDIVQLGLGYIDKALTITSLRPLLASDGMKLYRVPRKAIVKITPKQNPL